MRELRFAQYALVSRLPLSVICLDLSPVVFYMCSEKNIKAFADAVLDGSAEPEYKSAPIPEEPTDGGVTIVVGKNFDEIVKNKDKDVLLEVRLHQYLHACMLLPSILNFCKSVSVHNL